MKFTKIFIFILLISLLITACDLQVNFSPLDNQEKVFVEDLNAPADNLESADQIVNVYEVIANEEKLALRIESGGEVLYDDLTKICQAEVSFYTQPQDLSLIIFKPFNPGSDQPLKALYQFNLNTGQCEQLEISKELTDFGVLVVSPDQTKAALALESNEAKELKLLDLVNDKALSLVILADSETLNAGYGAMLNHFDIKWLDDQKIQYTVYEDTVKNYTVDAPLELEKVKEVRIVSVK